MGISTKYTQIGKVCGWWGLGDSWGRMCRRPVLVTAKTEML